MALLLMSLVIMVFVVYFYLIWLWYLSLLPLMLFFILVWFFTSAMNIKTQMFDNLAKYSLFVAWLVILAWIWLMLHFFGFSLTDISIWLTIVNLVLWIWSYLLSYKDGKLVFQIWYYMSLVFLLVNIYIQTNLLWFFDVFNIVWIAQLWVIWFIVYVVWMRVKIEDYMIYKLLFFCVWAVIIIVINQIQNLYLALFIWSVLLFGIYNFMYDVLKRRPPVQEKVVDVSIKRILAWDRIIQKTSDKRQSDFFKAIHVFLEKMPTFMKYFLDFFNTAIILILIVNYISNLWVVMDVYSQILYRLVIVLYIANVYVLRKIWYTNILQRFLIFLVINFAIYISMFSIFKSDISQAIMLLVVRNIASSLMVFYTHKTPLYKILQQNDYVYWIVSVFVALVANIVLLISKSSLPWQLLFALIFLYLWIQGMVLFYSIRYVKTKFFIW